jgi:VCBS repeat-containing protein
LTGIPTNAEVGDHSVELLVTDSGAGNLTDTQSFTVTVTNVNDAPVVTSGGIILFENASSNVQINVSDPDSGDTHTYSVTQPGALGGIASVNAAGVLTYDATGAIPGTENIEVTVTDQGGTGISVLVSIPITVNAIGEADSNADGVTDAQAIALGLDPNDADGDTDADGIPDANEIGDPDPLKASDTDGDGVIDALESGAAANDASIVNGLAVVGSSVEIISTGQTLSAASSSPTTGGPSGVSFPFGTISYQTTAPPVGSVTVRIMFSDPLPSRLALYQVDKTGAFTELPTSIWTRVDAATVDVTLTDGDPVTDLDGIVDGFIENAIAPAEVSSAGTSGGGGGGCVLNADIVGKDPVFPLLLLVSLGYLVQIKRRPGKVVTVSK